MPSTVLVDSGQCSVSDCAQCIALKPVGALVVGVVATTLTTECHRLCG